MTNRNFCKISYQSQGSRNCRCPWICDSAPSGTTFREKRLWMSPLHIQAWLLLVAVRL
nr:MAG TPA: hypothetical protein [Caudoviricetes sp.]